MKAPSLLSLVSLSVVASFVSSTSGVAYAADVEVAPRGTTPGLSVTVARDGKSVAFARAGGKPVEVQVTGRAVAGKKPEVVALSVGEGQKIVHVRVTTEEGPWEALLSPTSDEPLFAGRTGYARGTFGEREGSRVDVTPKGDGTVSVVVSDIREDTRICGEESTPLRPRALDPRTLTLRGATVQRLSVAARANARRVSATRVSEPRAPIASLLSLAGESGGQGLAKNLVDGRRDTAWTEDRPGIGQGEFVTFRTPTELGIKRLTVDLMPQGAPEDFAPPKLLYLVTPGEVRAVEIPEDVAFAEGGSVEIGLGAPLRGECVSVVLGEAYARGVSSPRVGFSGLSAYAALEDVPLASIVKDLGVNGEPGEAALAFLKRAGDKGLAAVAEAYPSSTPMGRARAVDVATAAPSCDAAGRVLLLGVVDSDKEASRKARDRIERCGRGAAKSLATGLVSDDPKLRAVSAELFGLVAPREALAPLVAALGRGDKVERSSVRAAVARASRNAPQATLDAFLVDAATREKVEAIRAFGARLGELEHAEAALSSLARSDEMKVRYVLVEPARALSLAHPERPAPLASFLDDRDAYVRARAAEAAAGVPSLGPKLSAKLTDPEPRVREAALVSLSSMGGAPEAEAIRVFETDEWTFVRVAAAKALGASRAPTQASVVSLEKALEGGPLLVRQAALSALSARRATSSAGAMAKLARDADSPLELRVAATRALGAVCASSEVDYLTRAAVRALAPIDEADLRVGVAAIDALGRIHPRDLSERLAKLREKTVRLPLKSAADRAVAETDVCR